jgi:ABC-type nitrate/sulfonate/bicarbonate transport system substrate-binding protein
MAASENNLEPWAMMRDALVAAGVSPERVRVVNVPDDDLDASVRVLGSNGIVASIQCGRDDQGVYFLAYHWYGDNSEDDRFCITPAHIPSDPAKVAIAVIRYLNDPKYTTQSQTFGFPDD